MASQNFKQSCLRVTVKSAIRIYSFYSQTLSPSLKSDKGYEIRESFQAQCYELKYCSSVISLLFGELLDITKDKAVQSCKFIVALAIRIVINPVMVTPTAQGKVSMAAFSLAFIGFAVTFLAAAFNLMGYIFSFFDGPLAALGFTTVLLIANLVLTQLGHWLKSKIRHLETKRNKRAGN